MDHTVQKKALEDSGRYLDSSLRIAAPPTVKRTDGKGGAVGAVDASAGGDSGRGNHGAGGRRRAWSTPVGNGHRQLSDRHLQEKLKGKAEDEVKQQTPKDDPLVLLIMLIGVEYYQIC